MDFIDTSVERINSVVEEHKQLAEDIKAYSKKCEISFTKETGLDGYKNALLTLEGVCIDIRRIDNRLSLFEIQTKLMLKDILQKVSNK